MYSIFYFRLPLVSFFLQTFILLIVFCIKGSFSSTRIFYSMGFFLSPSLLSCIFYTESRTYGTIHPASVWTNTSYLAKTLQAPFRIEPRFLQHTPLHIYSNLTWVGWLINAFLWSVTLSLHLHLSISPSFHSPACCPISFLFATLLSLPSSVHKAFFSRLHRRIIKYESIGWDLSVDLQLVRTSDLLMLEA